MQLPIPELLNIANSMHSSFQFKRALPLFDKVLELSPYNTEALLGRGLCLEALLEPQKALENFDKALAIKPFNHLVLFNRGLLWLKKME